MGSYGPNKETLRHQLQLEWQDHIQTRAQTWKTLEIEAALFLGLIGADLKLNNVWLTLVLGLILVIASMSGVIITVHHRRGQVRKFTHIDRLEEALGLHRPGLMDDVKPPAEFRWSEVLNPAKVNTPLFILRMHVAILLFASTYVVMRFILR